MQARFIQPTATLDRTTFLNLSHELGPEALGGLVELFSRGDGIVAELDAAIRDGDGPELARVAHRLKGGASTLAAFRLAELAAELEDRGRREQFDGGKELAREAACEFDRALAEMSVALEPALF